MRPEDVLANPALVLNQSQREHYFQHGYVVCRQALAHDWLRRAQIAYENALERSRSLEQSNRWFSLAPEHRGEAPCVYRIERLPDQDIEFWHIASESPLVDIAADVLGPDVIYRDSMINVKPPGDRGKVSWHQDFAFYPHTNVGTIQVLTAVYDITADQGPLMVLPGTHRGGVFDHYDDENQWVGEVHSRDLDCLDFSTAQALVCKAGDVIVLHTLTVHGSEPNRTSHARPLLYHGMSAGDSLPYTALTWGNSYTGKTVRGQGRRYAQHDSLNVRLPPDWSKGYTTIFEHQQNR